MRYEGELAVALAAAVLLPGSSYEPSAAAAQEADTLSASPAFRALCAEMPAEDAYVPPRGDWERRRQSPWGDPDRVDMTFSVTKSFLSSTGSGG